MSNIFDLQAYKATPVIPKSVQDVSALGFVHRAAPFLTASDSGGTQYVYDTLGRLSQVIFANQTTVVYNYDALGNRTSVVTTCGPNGC